MAPAKKRNVPIEDHEHQEYQPESQQRKRRMTNSTGMDSGRNIQKVMAQNIKAAGAHQSSPGTQVVQGRGKQIKQPPTPPNPSREIIDLSEEEPSVQDQDQGLMKREPATTRKLTKPCNGFPRFDKEDVSIMLSALAPSKFNYQLNSAILSQHSQWFRETLSHEVEEYDLNKVEHVKKFTGLVHMYELQFNPDTKFWLLVKTCITIPQSVRDSIDAAVLSEIQANAKACANAYANRYSPTRSAPEATESTPSLVGTTDSLAISSPEATLDGEPDASGPSPNIQDEKTATSAERGNVDVAEVKEQEDKETKEPINKPEVSEPPNENEESSRPSTDTTINKTASNIIAKISTPETIIQEPTKLEVCEAYNNLFLTYYSKTPEINTTNIQKALSQSELLLNIATYYRSLPTVRLHVNNILTQYGRELYQAIRQNPPRWLFLSIHLESGPIFKESLIHIVGIYPSWPWKTVPQSKLTPEVLAIIRTKVDELRSLRAKVNEALFMSTLSVAGKEVTLGVENKDVLDTWCTVQLWRDWFCRALNQAKASHSTTTTTFFDFDAAMYRTMAKGGDAYLPLANVKHWCEEYGVTRLDCAKWTAEDLEEDLAIMKRYAQGVVQPLLENQSMLSVVEDGIGYLTCTKVGNDELPWAKKASSLTTPSLP